MPDITTTPDYIADVWVDGYLEALRAANVPEDRFAQMLADSMPEDVRRELARRAARKEAEAYTQRMVDSGQMIRLPGGLMVEATRYDPDVHGEAIR